MAQVRFKGLVRLAGMLRQDLSSPISAHRRDQLQSRIGELLSEVDAILKSKRATPADMPVPSRRAYLFLKGVNWGKVQIADTDAAAAAAAAPAVVSWPGLKTFLDRILLSLASATAVSPALDEAHRSIQIMSRRVEGSIERSRLTPEQITQASRQMRAWLAFFADCANLNRYVEAVGRCGKLIEAARKIGYTDPTIVQFRPTRHLYHVVRRTGRTLITLPTEMIAFDEPQLAIVAEMIAGGGGAAKQKLYEATALEAYQAMHAQLETLGGVSEQTRGMHHDLDEVFTRVNAAWFEGKLARPRLTWSVAFTGRKMGHYEAMRDMVMISRSLDRADVPAFVIDFLMYHELLHKQLGTRWSNGRGYAHTAEFRKLENRFPRRGEAEALLRKLGA